MWEVIVVIPILCCLTKEETDEQNNVDLDLINR